MLPHPLFIGHVHINYLKKKSQGISLENGNRPKRDSTAIGGQAGGREHYML